MSVATQTSIRDQLDELLAERILVLDGSMGALIYSQRAERGGLPRQRASRITPMPLKNCTEVLVLTQPKLIEDIHRAYLEAGADIIETDTFNGNRLSLEEFGLEEHVVEMNRTRRRDRPPRRRRVHAPQPRQAPVRRRQHRADQQDSSRWASTSRTPAGAT